jgi:undecaprenyl-phosphate galactose phosphotransferase/putative colanic acid biosynthesis UDP-glucose lipid carrier transferase
MGVYEKTNIDPPIFNVPGVLASVIGPRPHMLMHTEYSELINNYLVRHYAKPEFQVGTGKRFSRRN